MCIDIDGHHSGGSSFVYVNDFCYYINCLYTHRYKFSSEKKKKGKESWFIVSRASEHDNSSNLNLVSFSSNLHNGLATLEKSLINLL